MILNFLRNFAEKNTLFFAQGRRDSPRTVFLCIFATKSRRGSGFRPGPRYFLALPKKRAKNRDFRVFFSRVFSSYRGLGGRRAGGADFCRPAAPDLGNTQSKKDTDENGMQKCVICARSATDF